MGVAKGALSLLFELKKDIDFCGTVVQLGRQTTYITPSQAHGIGRSFGFDITTYNYINADQALNPSMISDIDLFKLLGFERVESIDYSDREKPTYVLDLNLPVTQELHAKYDAIYDGGTLEHIFDFPQSLKNIHYMLKPEGFVIHASVSHNHVDHGFYMFSPTVFYDYYKVNQYNIMRSYIFEYEPEHDTKPWIIYDYKPGFIDELSFGGWGKKMLGIWFVAQKKSISTCTAVPQQSSYIKVWNGISLHEKQHGIVVKIINILKGNAFLFKFGKNIFHFFKSEQRPSVIARY